MKKLLRVLGVIIVLLLAAIILLPLIYKDKIMEFAKDEASKTVNADINFNNDIKLNLFKSFPNFSVQIMDLSVVNREPFSGDTLAGIQSIKATLDIMSVIKGDKIEIRTIELNSPNIYLHVLPDGTANWDIAIETDSTEDPGIEEEESETKFHLGLKNYAINHANFIYNDESSDMFMSAIDLTHSGSGDFTQDVFDLNTSTQIEALTLKMEGVNYLKKVNTGLDINLEMDMLNSKYTLKDNSLQLNEFILKFSGFVAMPAEDIQMDISFEAPTTEFRNLLSLVPTIFMKDFESLKTSGKIGFDGSAKGIYNESQMPSYNFNLSIDKGMFKYPDLPRDVNNVNLKLNVKSDDGEPDHTVINLSKLHFELGKEPFDAKLIAKTPISDPFLDAAIKGKIDLNQIKDIVQLDEGTGLTGTLTADLELRGNYSSIEKEDYEAFHAAGNVVFNDLVYKTEPNLNVEVPIINLEFSPKVVTLKELVAKVKDSDIKANGSLDNFIAYFFGKGTLNGQLSLFSDKLDLNQIMSATGTEAAEETSTAEETSEELTVFELPDNINFTMNAAFKKVLYEDMDLSNVFCKLILKEKVLNIENLSLGIFDGTIKGAGIYNTQDVAKPLVKFDIALKNFGIQETFNTFEFVQKFAPVCQFANGNFNAELLIETALDQHMNPVFESLYSDGNLKIKEATIEGSKAQQKIASAIKMDRFNTIKLKNIKVFYEIKDGRLSLKEPLDFKIDKAEFIVDGFTSLDQTIDYNMKSKIPSGELQSQANDLFSELTQGKVDGPIGETINVTMKLTGTVTDPKVKVSLGEGAGVKDQIKDKIKDEFDKQKKELEDKANREIEKQKQELERKKKEAEAQAKRELEKKKREAEEKARREAEKQKKKLEEEAKKKLKKLF